MTAILLAGTLLAACSSSGNGDEQVQGQDRPNLAQVPGERPETTSQQDREVIYQGLYADREHARHVEGPIASETARRDAARQTADLEGVQRFFPRNRRDVEIAEERRRRVLAFAQELGLNIRSGGFVARLQFAPGETTLPAGSGRQILQIARFQRAVGGDIALVGHTVRAGQDDSAKEALSLQRAQAVANSFRSLGIPQDDLQVAGRADRQPITRDEDRDAENARVDIYLRNVPGL